MSRRQWRGIGPFLHATVIANDNDGIEGRIEDRLAVLFTAGELFPLLSSELLRRFYQQIAKKLVNDSLGVGSRRGIEFRYFAGKGVQAINRDYLPDLPQPANDLVESVPWFPAMLRPRIRGALFVNSTGFPCFFETFAQVPAKSRQIIGQLLVSGVA